MIGSIVLIFILLFLTVGLVVAVRFALKRVRDSVLAGRTGAKRQHASGAATEEEESVYDEEGGPITGRELKERYLRGEMSKAEYDRRLRALQLNDFLRDRQ